MSKMNDWLKSEFLQILYGIADVRQQKWPQNLWSLKGIILSFLWINIFLKEVSFSKISRKIFSAKP